MKLSDKQEEAIIASFKEGTPAVEIKQLFSTTKHQVSRILTGAGLTKPFTPWADDHVARLHVLHNDGLSFDQMRAIINSEFNASYSRNSVIGKAHRLGLFRERAPTNPVVTKSAVEPARKTPFRRPPKIKPEPFVAQVIECVPINVTLLELEDGMCKWPTGDATYCGCATANRRMSYCPTHHNAGTMAPAKYRGYWKGVSR